MIPPSVVLPERILIPKWESHEEYDTSNEAFSLLSDFSPIYVPMFQKQKYSSFYTSTHHHSPGYKTNSHLVNSSFSEIRNRQVDSIIKRLPELTIARETISNAINEDISSLYGPKMTSSSVGNQPFPIPPFPLDQYSRLVSYPISVSEYVIWAPLGKKSNILTIYLLKIEYEENSQTNYHLNQLSSQGNLLSCCLNDSIRHIEVSPVYNTSTDQNMMANNPTLSFVVVAMTFDSLFIFKFAFHLDSNPITHPVPHISLLDSLNLHSSVLSFSICPFTQRILIMTCSFNGVKYLLWDPNMSFPSNNLFSHCAVLSLRSGSTNVPKTKQSSNRNAKNSLASDMISKLHLSDIPASSQVPFSSSTGKISWISPTRFLVARTSFIYQLELVDSAIAIPTHIHFDHTICSPTLFQIPFHIIKACSSILNFQIYPKHPVLKNVLFIFFQWGLACFDLRKSYFLNHPQITDINSSRVKFVKKKRKITLSPPIYTRKNSDYFNPIILMRFISESVSYYSFFLFESGSRTCYSLNLSKHMMSGDLIIPLVTQKQLHLPFLLGLDENQIINSDTPSLDRNSDAFNLNWYEVFRQEDDDDDTTLCLEQKSQKLWDNLSLFNSFPFPYPLKIKSKLNPDYNSSFPVAIMNCDIESAFGSISYNSQPNRPIQVSQRSINPSTRSMTPGFGILSSLSIIEHSPSPKNTVSHFVICLDILSSLHIFQLVSSSPAAIFRNSQANKIISCFKQKLSTSAIQNRYTPTQLAFNYKPRIIPSLRSRRLISKFFNSFEQESEENGKQSRNASHIPLQSLLHTSTFQSNIDPPLYLNIQEMGPKCTQIFQRIQSQLKK